MSRRPGWLSGPALRLHAALLTGLAVAGAATWLEWTRARSGHPVAWVYAFEWPLFGLLGGFLWWRLLRADRAPQPDPEPDPHAGLAAGPDPGTEPDPDLLAWQAYLARLHEADPPGGPPADRPRDDRLRGSGPAR